MKLEPERHVGLYPAAAVVPNKDSHI